MRVARASSRGILPELEPKWRPVDVAGGEGDWSSRLSTCAEEVGCKLLALARPLKTLILSIPNFQQMSLRKQWWSYPFLLLTAGAGQVGFDP